MTQNSNYQYFLETNLSSYIGQWVAICNKTVVAHGKDVKKVFHEAKEKCPKTKPLLTRVPDKETMIF